MRSRLLFLPPDSAEQRKTAPFFARGPLFYIRPPKKAKRQEIVSPASCVDKGSGGQYSQAKAAQKYRPLMRAVPIITIQPTV